MSTILIVDDEPGIRTVLTDILEDEDHNVVAAEDGISGLSILREQAIDLVILDVLLPKMGGIDVLREIKSEFKDIEVIVISGHANIDIAVKAVKLGAFDFVEKPLSMDKIINLVNNALKIETLRKENESLKNSLFIEDKMIGSSDAMNAVWNRIQQSAETDAKVFIHGENGTGKELIAREIHRRSNRSHEPFVEVNCAAIPDTLIESELFGHEKGAFTSAVAQRKGKFETADGGTLFLDEIADMSLSAQAKVLRAVQEQRFERIGGEESITVDVRILAATNKDIQTEISEGRFREDLFFRLNVVPIEVPALRDRISDLPQLVDYFITRFSQEAGRQVHSVTPEGMRVLEEYQWPGNVRELKNFVERITIMAGEEEISEEIVRHFLGEQVKSRIPRSDGLREFSEMKLNDAKNELERRLITMKLEENGFNISRTAEVLGIYPSNLHGKIKKFGIRIER